MCLQIVPVHTEPASASCLGRGPPKKVHLKGFRGTKHLRMAWGSLPVTSAQNVALEMIAHPDCHHFRRHRWLFIICETSGIIDTDHSLKWLAAAMEGGLLPLQTN